MTRTRYPHTPVLVVDDEERILQSLRGVLESNGINNVICCQDSRELLDILEQREIGVLLLDLTMPYLTGEELLPLIKLDHPDLPIIVITGVNDISTAVECMRLGACDYLVKAIENSKLVGSVKRAIQMVELRQENLGLKRRFFSNELENPQAFKAMVTVNAKMRNLFLYVESVAGTSQAILILGETGVGKELLAEAVHTLSGRSGAYVTVNVAGLDDGMFSDTLFGHRRGAFTGASEHRKGLVERASGGTLFLDEIGDLSTASQVKLLRLLESGEYYTLGSDVARKADVRLVTSTNRDLLKLMDKGEFRRDLYYRLVTHELEIPPLRERRDDLPLLVDHFLEVASREMGKKKPTPPPELLTLLGTFPFPGNVRELGSLIFDAVGRHKKGVLSLRSFSKSGESRRGKTVELTPAVSGEGFLTFTDRLPTLKEASRLIIEEALRRSKGNQSVAARLLGISQSALSKRLGQTREGQV